MLTCSLRDSDGMKHVHDRLGLQSRIGPASRLDATFKDDHTLINPARSTYQSWRATTNCAEPIRNRGSTKFFTYEHMRRRRY